MLSIKNAVNRARVPALVAIFLSLLLPHTAAYSFEKPEVVRIAAIATNQGGKNVVSGGQSAAIAANGWLEDELKKIGVKFEWYPVSAAVGGPLFNEALANRSADFANYGDFPALIAKAGGIDIKLIVPSGHGTNSYLITAANSPAQSIKDLKGKRIAIHRGRPLELAFSKLVSSNGLKYKDFKIYNVNSQAGAAALAAGDVDALFTGSDAFQLQDNGVGKIIWTSKGTPWKWRAELFVRKEFADKYPEVTQIVANAYVKASYWASQEENRKEVIRYATLLGTPENVVLRDYEGDGDNWKDRFSPLFDPLTVEHYREAAEFTLAEKLISRKVDVKDLIDTRFLDTALKEQKLEAYWTPRTK
ncbi:ABC transporter substrate-binding protein [Candidatus Methylospira mobilis]|uniref:ABC transporter substrate-binding protein n=1 Tax=Candidatus Methylospira mobilis TaxID=1808979 RepID=UPI0028ED70E6|nr:ABC transporter substrate-binding protein [Candidatus Methylospira mobilis]WNV04142.1 ABC transporter substrate-binding protein [Candidatus Methylospira mobilis]